MIDHLSQSLKLTKDQTAKLKKIAADSEKTIAPLRQCAAKSSQALRAALLAAKYDTKNVKNLAAKAEAAEAKIINTSIDTWTKTRAVLTSAQAANLQKNMSMQRQRPAGGSPPGRR